MEELFRFYPERGLYQPIVQWGLFVVAIASIILSIAMMFSKRLRDYIGRVIFRFKDSQ